MPQGVLYRTAKQADLPFIFGAWLENYGNASPLTVHIPKTVFYREHRRIIDNLLRKDGIQVMLAVLDEDPAVILGFMVYEFGGPDTIHFVYVKTMFRRHNVANDMLAIAGIDLNKSQITHWTYLLSQVKQKWPKMAFNPYALEVTHGSARSSEERPGTAAEG